MRDGVWISCRSRRKQSDRQLKWLQMRKVKVKQICGSRVYSQFARDAVDDQMTKRPVWQNIVFWHQGLYDGNDFGEI